MEQEDDVRNWNSDSPMTPWKLPLFEICIIEARETSVFLKNWKKARNEVVSDKVRSELDARHAEPKNQTKRNAMYVTRWLYKEISSANPSQMLLLVVCMLVAEIVIDVTPVTVVVGVVVVVVAVAVESSIFWTPTGDNPKTFIV